MHLPASFIKNIAIEIRDDYSLTNAPFSTENDKEHSSGAQKNTYNHFIGREAHIDKFLEFLDDSNTGIFLVTGERGIGKTSFVNHVLKDYKKKNEDREKKEPKVNNTEEKGKTTIKNKPKENTENEAPKKGNTIITIPLTLSQNKPREIDILWLMVSHVYDQFETFLLNNPDYDEIKKAREQKERFKRSFLFTIMACAAPLFLIWKAETRWNVFFNLDKNKFSAESNSILFQSSVANIIAYLLLFVGFSIFVYLFLFRFTKYKKLEADKSKKNNIPQNRIKMLRDRCNALMTEEIGGEEEINIEGIIGSLFGRKEKTTKKYPIASPKEIEYELQEFLLLCESHEKYTLKFIFIFDELDKVDPVVTSTYLYEDLDKFQKTENANPLDLRDRKQAIINLIAGLKNFFTIAKARFIFIAGNEMFDAALADISDRQASISSIFTYTFHIESFLKERNIGRHKNNDSLSAATEEYLKWVLFGTEDNVKTSEPGVDNPPGLSEENILKLIKLKLKLKCTTSDHELQIAKAIITIQNFITYLTYRANGSPKKIIKIIHEFITVKKANDTWRKGEDGKTIFLNQEAKVKDEKKPVMFLYFNYSNQYRIGFISYLYRPFLIQYGRNFKLFSDNIIISTPYLFDHLLKFHPFAFSLSNLEMIPEVVSINKTPSLQEHLSNIIEYLGENHIRRTDLGLFDYKFYSRTLNEITYISKLFEEEAAAFNFTLDESYLVKIFVRSKIKELRSIYSKFLGDTKEAGTKQIFSIAHLNGILGDLHFFDQEYDDAIVSYSDAIRPINNLEIVGMSMREFITLFRNKLKLGLCFERTSSYDEALAFYADCCQDAKRFMMYRLLNSRDVVVKTGNKTKEGTDNETKEGTDNETKERFDNKFIYTTSSLNDLLQVIIQGFLATIIVEEKMGMEGITPNKLNISLGNFLSLADPIISKTGGNEYNSLVFANAFLLMGKLFYFKNTSLYIDHTVFNNFPGRLKNRFQQLSENSAILNPSENDTVTRKPTIALFMYLVGIFEIIESGDLENLFFIENLKSDNQNKFIKNLLEKLEDFLEKDYERFLSYHYKYIANFLSSIGDCLLSMCEVKNYREIKIGDLFNCGYLNSRKDDDYNFIKAVNIENDNEIGIILKTYYLSGKFFLKYGRSIGCSYEYKKILYVLKTAILRDDRVLIEKFTSFIESTLVRPALEIASQNAGHTDRHMIKKIEKIYEDNDKPIYKDNDNTFRPLSFALNNISNNPETKEIIIVYNYIKLKLIDKYTINTIISSFNSLGTQYLRLVELEFYAKYIFVKYFEKDRLLDIPLAGDNIKHAIDYLYSMLSMLRIQKIYGNDFLIGHSSFAYTHLRIAKFLKKYNITRDIKDGIENIIGKGSYVSYDPVYHFQMAKDLYIKVTQLHSTGKEYKKTIGEMIYLEDDFSDNAYHFGAAINRYLMTNKDFEKKIKECENEISADDYYNPSSYMNN